MLSEIDRGELSVVLEFQLPDEMAGERLLGRASVEGRSDDAPEMVQHRLDVYHRQTEPLVAYYRARGMLVGIHADRSVEDVFAEVQQVLSATEQASS